MRMPGTMTKAQALEWLARHGSTARCYPQEPAAAYLGLGTRRFRQEVAAGRLPQPDRHGKRIVWDKVALDRHLDKKVDGVEPGTHAQASTADDPIMRSIHAAQSAALCSGDPH